MTIFIYKYPLYDSEMTSGKSNRGNGINPYARTIEIESIGKRPDHTKRVIDRGNPEENEHSVESINPPPSRPPETLTGRIRQEIDRIRAEEEEEEGDGKEVITTQDIACRPNKEELNREEPIPLTKKVDVKGEDPTDDPTHQETPKSKYALSRDIRADIGRATDDPRLVSSIEDMCSNYKMALSKTGDNGVYEGKSNNIPLSMRFAAYDIKGGYIYSFIVHDKRTSLRLALSKEDPSTSQLDLSIMFNNDFLLKKDLHKAIRQGLPAYGRENPANTKDMIMRVLTSVPAARDVGKNNYKRSSNRINTSMAGYAPDAFSRIIDSVNSFYSEKDLTQY